MKCCHYSFYFNSGNLTRLGGSKETHCISTKIEISGGITQTKKKTLCTQQQQQKNSRWQITRQKKYFKTMSNVYTG